jgi:hypothetical protein
MVVLHSLVILKTSPSPKDKRVAQMHEDLFN